MTPTPLSPLIDLTLVIDLVLRSSIIVLAGLLFSAMLRGRSAALRHSVLAAAIAGAAAVVPLSLVVPTWDVPLLARLSSASALRLVSTDAVRSARGPDADEVTTTGDAATTRVTVRASTGANTTTVGADAGAGRARVLVSSIAIVWIAGVALGMAFLTMGLGHLGRVIARAERVRDGRWVEAAARLSRAYGLRRPIVVLQTDVPDLLATWGLFRPRVLLPAHARGWDDDRIEVVLRHELAHIERLDWFVQLGAEVMRTIGWFNPLLWIACARLRRESEQACDDAVLRAGVSGQDYAGHLLDVARGCRRAGRAWATAVPMARTSTLERRIAAMLNPRLERAALTRRGIALSVIMLALVTVPMAALRGAQTTPLPLVGSVYDASGGVLPGVQVTLANAQATVNATATTDGTGRFVFESVAPGRYVLQAKLEGFKRLRQEFDLTDTKDWDRALTLGVGDVQEVINVRASAPATPTPRAATGPSPLRVGGNIRAPMKLTDVRPVYPESMRDEGREGEVVMDGVIGTDGSVISVRILSAQVHPDFAIAAVEAVRQWKYSPTLLNGVPVPIVMTVSVNFSLE